MARRFFMKRVMRKAQTAKTTIILVKENSNYSQREIYQLMYKILIKLQLKIIMFKFSPMKMTWMMVIHLKSKGRSTVIMIIKVIYKKQIIALRKVLII
jgi:hypothetical protein